MYPQNRRSTMIGPLSPTIFTISSDLGPLEIELRGDVVYRLSFSTTKNRSPRTVSLAPLQQKIVDLLQQYAAGEPVDLASIAIDLTGFTPFATRVYQQCRKIPLGTTLSYGQLAARAGSPAAARAVGGAMARNRIPLLIPCHRVVASTGKLHGFSAPQGLKLKDRLLRLEHATFT
ncbi:methylated-DNA--[protein]-cysteine S-methyltransferase [Blastopirellula marina]|uniref:methylated-DNA--[protein]-cysteine S-methyltransferase n=1 Tax=Blastopirellula marina DSM 3645 TaxID=314230 RepID=A3ZZU7_9BACT|nr:methylated-DNA--[protein]-cysteine S-methyltransferase [Blastopirellula marina]EAQ77888.1 methylated-DNA-protein-cysteine methyltransferase, selenocysteine-containing [Blastopirellula marina DSM 3645]